MNSDVCEQSITVMVVSARWYIKLFTGAKFGVWVLNICRFCYLLGSWNHRVWYWEILILLFAIENDKYVIPTVFRSGSQVSDSLCQFGQLGCVAEWPGEESLTFVGFNLYFIKRRTCWVLTCLTFSDSFQWQISREQFGQDRMIQVTYGKDRVLDSVGWLWGLQGALRPIDWIVLQRTTEWKGSKLPLSTIAFFKKESSIHPCAHPR